MTTKHLCDHTGVEIPAKDYHGPTRFTFEGTDYEIDLSTGSSRAFAAAQKAHREAHEAMGVFATKGRSQADIPAKTNPAEVRKWAAANGHPESGPGKRGRIPAKITAAYEASVAGAMP